jgi:competence protein ComEA
MHFRSLRIPLFFCSIGVFSVSAQTLPEGQGKALVEKVCSSCHGLDQAVADGYSEQGWKKLVNTMIARGAEASDDEIDLMVKYLAKNFPEAGAAKVSVNKATAKDLAAGLSLSDKDAAAIIAYRQEHGNFKDLPGLKKVPGVDAQKIDAAKDMISFD